MKNQSPAPTHGVFVPGQFSASKTSGSQTSSTSESGACRGVASARAIVIRVYVFLAMILLLLGASSTSAQTAVLPGWFEQSPVTSPPARSVAALAYDAGHNQVVLFGGYGSTNDTWLWNGVNWSQANPATSPSARGDMAMVYDAAQGQVVMFGGLDPSTGNRLGDTWLWDGTTWSQPTLSNSPPARDGSYMAYDAAHGQVVMFGGVNQSGLETNDTWLWNGATWTQANPSTNPGARSGHVMAYDSAHSQVVLFGGNDPTLAYLSDTWTWDGTNWTQQNPPNSPPGRESGGMAYNAALGVTILFGGAIGTGGNTDLNDTWAWNGLNWTEQGPLGSGPSARIAVSNLTYDSALGQIILFSGLAQTADTWEWGTPGNFGNVNVCPSGQTTPAPCSSTVALTFQTTGGTFGNAPHVVTQGNTGLDFALGSGSTCIGTASPGICTVTATFTPQAPGLRMGAIQLFDYQGNLLTTTPLYGNGQGPAVVFGSGAQTVLPASGLNRPSDLALDGAGDLFIADYANNQIVKLTSGGVQTTVPTGTLNGPSGVAVDGAGNIFISDNGSKQVLEIPAGCTTSACQVTVPTTGLDNTNGRLAVDGAGDIFVADTGNARVIEITPSGVQTTVPATGLSGPFGVAVDAAGDVFIADTYGNKVVEVTAAGVQTTVPTVDVTSPENVWVDAAGDVFVADSIPNNRIVEIPAGGGAQVTVFTGQAPEGVVTDGAGNIFIADTFNDRVVEINLSQPPTFNFDTTYVGSFSDDSPKSTTFQNVGNQTLSHVAPGLIVGGGGYSQTLGTSSVADCTSSFSLVPGAECNLSISFRPASQGTFGSVVAFTDNALNGSGTQQLVYLYGSGLNPPVTFTLSGAGTGNGSVSSSPSGINCNVLGGVASGTCSAGFGGGSTIGLQEIPSPGYTFAGWGGACANSGTNQQCIVTVNAASTAIATFTLTPSIPLNVSLAGTGSGGVVDSLSQIACNEAGGIVSGTCAANYVSGAAVTLTAVPSGGSVFVGWGGDCASSSANPTCNLTVNSGLNVSATYLAPGASQAGTLKPITAGVVYGQGGSLTQSNAGTSASGLNNPIAIAFDGSGNLYVADRSNNRVLFYPAGSTTATRVYGQNGSFTSSSANNGGVSATSLSQPWGIVLDSGGDLYISDYSNNRVLFYPAGSTTATRVYGQGGDFTANIANNGGISANSISTPQGLAVDTGGNLYVSDGNARVLYYPAGSTTATRVYGQNGDFTSLAQNNGGVNANSLSNPQTLTVDSSGDLYIADSNNNRVLFYPYNSTTATLVYGQRGSFTTTFPGSTANTLQQPWGTALDTGGNLYVTDYINNRVVFYPLGSTTATRVYGQGGSFNSNSVNDGGISANSLNQPTGVALDSRGNVYVTDIYNNRVLEYGSYGNVNVCPTGLSPAPCNSTITSSYYASTDTTFGGTQVVTQGANGLDFSLASGGTCTGTVSAGNTCTVNVNFAPVAPGLRMGSAQLYDTSANLIASTSIYGTGQAPEIAFGPGTANLVNTGTFPLSSPRGMLADAAGNLFISDAIQQQVLKIAPGGAVTTVGSGYQFPQGLAEDGAGDLFVADNNLNAVVEIPAGCTIASCQQFLGTNLRSQLGIAVDGAGDLFIGDFLDGKVVEIPAGCTTTACQTVVYNPTGSQPVGLRTDAAGDLFVADFGLKVVMKLPAGCTNASCAVSIGTGWSQPDDVAVDAAGDVFVADQGLNEIVEVPVNCATASCQIVVASGINTVALALDASGDIFIDDLTNLHVIKINSSQPQSMGFAITNVGSTSTDSPQPLTVQNIGNQPLTGSLAQNLGGNFTENSTTDCSTLFPLAPGAVCSESFGFTPQSATYLTGATVFTNNSLNVATAAQTITFSGTGATNGVAGTVAVPNVVGQVQAAASTPITAVGLAMGTVTTESSDSVAAGSIISENPIAGTQVAVGSIVNLLVSSGIAQPPSPNPLFLENNYFLTGDYVTAGVTLRGTGVGGVATGTITIPNSAQGVPAGADIVDAFLYWETIENTPTASSMAGTFNGFSIAGSQIGTDIPNYTDGAVTGTLRAYKANINIYLPIGTNGVRLAAGNYSVSLPDSGGSTYPLTEGASMVLIYRVLSPNFPLKSVVIYDGAVLPTVPTTQVVNGFYDAVGGANGTGNLTTISAVAGSNWSNSASAVPLGQSDHYNATLNSPGAYAAVILSTPVNNSDNDGLLDAWKTGPAAGDFHAGQPGYYDVKTNSWVGLPGAKHGQKDLFVQMDYMCGAVLSDGSCDPTQENLFPSPDANGNDPLAMVQQAFANSGVQLHLQVGNAIPEDTCVDDPTNPTQLCQFPNEPGVIGWKNSLEFSKLYPRDLAGCLGGGDCTTRFPYGQKDSYHYVLFGHALALPAYNTPYGSLTSIIVSNGVTTLGTVDRGAGINACPSRITIEGVLGNPGLNGVYNTTGCSDSKTITLATPGVTNWSYPNNTLPEPIIGVTFATVTSISGYSDLGGADSAVTLGLWLTAPNQDMSKKATILAGTLFHEIGHTLGLSHGGLYYDTPGNYVPTFEANCKPNYQSIMNYLFQLDGVGPNQAIAYSNQTLATLNENTAGSVASLTDMNNQAATFPTSAWYVPYVTGSPVSAATLHCDGTPLNGGSAYRIDAPIAPITPAWTNGQDLNFIGTLQSQERGFNDINNMDLRQIGATGGEFASLATLLSFGNSVSPLNISAGGSVALGSGGTVTLGSGGRVTLGSAGNVTLGSGGTIALGSGGDVTFSSGGNVTLGNNGDTITPGSGGRIVFGSAGNVTLSSGGTITLGSGGRIVFGSAGNVTLSSAGAITPGIGGAQVIVPPAGGTYAVNASDSFTLSSGGNILVGSGGNVTLDASGGTIALGSGGRVILGSAGTITLGSGGRVILGSAGTIAMGSGGNITLGSGGTITLGSGGTITLGSGGNVTLGSGGTVTLGSGGNLAQGSGGNVTLGSGGEATLGAGGTITLGSGGRVILGSAGDATLSSGGTITLGSGGTITLGSGGRITMGSAGTVTDGGVTTTYSAGAIVSVGSGGRVTLGSGGNILLGSGGRVTLGSAGTIALGSGGTITLGSGGRVTMGSAGVVTLGTSGVVNLGIGAAFPLGTVSSTTPGSGGPSSTELTYETANSVVRPPTSPTETTTPAGVRITWNAPAFGVVQTYTIYRSANGATAIVIGSVSGINGNPPATEFTDTNPVVGAQTVVYTVTTTLVPDTGGASRSSVQSAPAVIQYDQSIVLGPLPSSVIITSPVTVTATAMSSGVPNGLLVAFSATGSCTIGAPSLSSNVTSATVTLNATGSCTVTASQSGMAASQPGAIGYNAANSVSGTFMILAQGSATKSQTINFAQLPNVQYGNSFSVSASSSAGLPVTFTTPAAGPCALAGAVGTVSGVGTCSITASVAATSTYSAASLTQSFTIYPAVLKVTAANVATTYGQSLPAFTYAYSGFVPGDTAAVIVGAPALSTTATASSPVGSYPIIVSTGSMATTNYSFLYVNGTLTVQLANQAALTLNTTSPLTYNQSETLSVLGGTTNGAVSYSSTSLCTIVGAQLTANSGTGSCLITATMAGNSNYNAVTSTPASIVTLALASQSINFTTSPPATAPYNGTFTVAATATSGATVTFTNSGGACSNVGALYTMTSGSGICSVIASQTGNANYSAATPVTKTVNATLAAPTVTFAGAPASAAYHSTFVVTATTNASTTPVISSSGGACTNVLTAVTMTSGTGTCSLTATWAADSNYAATTKGQSTIAAPAAQTINFTTNPPATAAYNSTFTVAATGGASGNPVTFTSAGVCSNSGAVFTMTNSTGTCSVIANQASNVNYAAATQVTKTATATGPLVSVSPSSINFGIMNQGSIKTQTITITNVGTAPVTINDPILSLVKGGNSNEFIALSLCPKPLAVGKSCSVTIAFLAGPFYTPQTATLQIMSNAPGSPLPVPLSAQVINPLASFNPSSLNFGTVKHATSLSMNVVLSNPGASPLSLTTLSVTGTNAAYFTQTNNCGTSLAAGANCTIAVKFTPAVTGTFSANLTVVDNASAGGGTQTVPLSGKGN